MAATQSKRARFAHRQRQRRRIARIHREHGATPGYLGAVTTLTLTDAAGQARRLGAGSVGALFMTTRRAAHERQQLQAAFFGSPRDSMGAAA